MVGWDAKRDLGVGTSLGGVVLGALLLGACGPGHPTDAPPDGDELGVVACEAQGLDEWMLQLALEVPGGFGGYFLDAGVPTAYLVDLTQAPDAARVLARATGFSPTRFRFLQGQADFGTLMDLRCYLSDSDVLAGLQPVTLDADERRNRVVVGVVDAREQEQVGVRLVEAGVDTTLVLVELAASFRALPAP